MLKQNICICALYCLLHFEREGCKHMFFSNDTIDDARKQGTKMKTDDYIKEKKHTKQI